MTSRKLSHLAKTIAQRSIETAINSSATTFRVTTAGIDKGDLVSQSSAQLAGRNLLIFVNTELMAAGAISGVRVGGSVVLVAGIGVDGGDVLSATPSVGCVSGLVVCVAAIVAVLIWATFTSDAAEVASPD